MSINNTKKLPISAIILTYNEENNIEDCIKSVYDIAEEIFIVDSYSRDKTLEIAGRYTDKIFQHPFENYSRQRNWAFKNLPINTEWILNLDADHRITVVLKNELFEIFNNEVEQEVKGFLASRRTMFMGRWIKHGGHYPVYHAVLFRNGSGYCEDRLYDQHFVVDGRVELLKGDIIDIITDSLTSFTERHNKWATLEAFEQLDPGTDDVKIKPNRKGNPIEQRRYLRNFYGRFPLFVRPFLYFMYRFFIKLGFLDGTQGLVFHFLQGFWYRFLVDAKIYEIRKKMRSENKNLEQAVYELYGIEIRN